MSFFVNVATVYTYYSVHSTLTVYLRAVVGFRVPKCSAYKCSISKSVPKICFRHICSHGLCSALFLIFTKLINYDKSIFAMNVSISTTILKNNKNPLRRYIISKLSQICLRHLCSHRRYQRPKQLLKLSLFLIFRKTLYGYILNLRTITRDLGKDPKIFKGASRPKKITALANYNVLFS